MRLRCRARSSGSVLVEFTLIVPFLVLLLLGTWNYGYAFFRYSQLEEAVRDGARYASIRSLDDNSPGQYVAAVRCMVATGTPGCSRPSIVPGLTPEQVSVQRIPPTGKPSQIEVFITTFEIARFIPANIANKPRARFPYGGMYGLPN